MYSLRARFYSPTIGCFLSQDIYPYNIADPAQLNRYVYSANNPINFVDPLGLQAFVEYSTLNEEKQKEAAAVEGRAYSSKGSSLIDDAGRTYCSFSADTEIATKDGEKAISEIQIGDYVLAWNWETGEINWYPVTAKLEHEDKVIVHLVIDDEKITTTPEHPFYTEENGWVNASDLKEGMHVRNADGKYGEVKSVTAEKSTQWMYNLTVDEAHTFYVGDGQWLVHNMCPVGEGDSGLVRVGRWMSKSEYEDLLATSRVQPGAGNVTSVSYPASPASYGSQANPGSVYVEFDVPVNSLIQGGRADWFTILGPDSTLAKALLRAGRITELPQFPSIYNIVLLAIK